MRKLISELGPVWLSVLKAIDLAFYWGRPFVFLSIILQSEKLTEKTLKTQVSYYFGFKEP